MKLLKLPALIDVHVHLRDPGATRKEDFETGTKAAVAGGFSVILDMPNNPGSPVVSETSLHEKETIASEKSYCDYGLFFGADLNENYLLFSKVIPKVCGLKVYMNETTGDLLIEDINTLENIFKYWQSEKPIVVHAEEKKLVIALSFASLYKRKLHVAHISLASELALVINAKEKGLPITCEVTPHHLFLTEEDTKRLGPYGIMKPCLKSKKDVDYLWKNIRNIDCIGSDHAPHTKAEKESETPPFGVPNLETTVPLLLNAVIEKRLTIDDIVRLLHTNPVSIFSIPVSHNSYTEVDINASYSIKNSNLFTKCRWSPFEEMKVYGKVVKTVVRGHTVFDNGITTGKKGYGKNLFI